MGVTYPTAQPADPAARPGRWARMKPIHRVAVLLAALTLPCCGGVALIGAFADDAPPAEIAAPAVAPLSSAPLSSAPPASAAASSVSPAASSVAPPAPVVETRTVTERAKISFKTRRVDDRSLPEGETRVRTKGASGERTLTYEVTVTDGEETARKLVKSVVSRKPVTKVVAVGTKPASSGGGGCDPNYRPCVPVASGVDCAGGSGNGPAYVDGPVRVIGDDPYALDRDGDGVACD